MAQSDIFPECRKVSGKKLKLVWVYAAKAQINSNRLPMPNAMPLIMKAIKSSNKYPQTSKSLGGGFPLDRYATRRWRIPSMPCCRASGIYQRARLNQSDKEISGARHTRNGNDRRN